MDKYDFLSMSTDRLVILAKNIFRQHVSLNINNSDIEIVDVDENFMSFYAGRIMVTVHQDMLGRLNVNIGYIR